jgi:hypothetical protein
MCDEAEVVYLCHLLVYLLKLDYLIRWCIQKFPDWVDNEIYAYNVKHSLRSNTIFFGGKPH